MRRQKILMLGWEFPPVINGGLGIACLGMAKALSKDADLTVILPQSDPQFVVNNVDLIGLNNVSLKDIQSIPVKHQIEKYAEVERIVMDLNPYEVVERQTFDKAAYIEEVSTERFEYSDADLELFKVGQLYDNQVIEKVLKYAKYATEIAKDKSFDVIHAHDWMTFLAGIRIKEATGKPLAVHVHSLSYDRAGAESRDWAFGVEKYGMEQADLVIPVSAYTGGVVRDHYGIDPGKIFPVHNGAEAVEPFKAEKSFPEKLVLFLGRVTGQKGPEAFLEIASKVISQNNDVRFVMAGTGDQLKRIIETGAYKKVGNKFHFTGFLNKEKVNELLAMADVYCMPSVSEPFGLSALEAAQFGIPAVISKQSGVAEVLHGALKADYWDIDRMASHIVTLLEDESTTKEVVNAGYKDLEALSWTNAAKKIIALFEEHLIKA